MDAIDYSQQTTVSTPNASIASAITASVILEGRDWYDRACKRILSEKIILGWILHECLEEFAGVSPEEIAAQWIEGNPVVGEVPLHADDYAPLIAGSNVEDDGCAGTQGDSRWRVWHPSVGLVR